LSIIEQRPGSDANNLGHFTFVLFAWVLALLRPTVANGVYMSLYIVLEKEIEGLDSYENGHALGAISDSSAICCEAAGVKHLMGFFSQDAEEMGAFMAGEGLDPSELDMPSEEWFDPSDGLATLDALEKDYGDQEDVVQEIAEWRHVLTVAKAAKIRWHLAVDF